MKIKFSCFVLFILFTGAMLQAQYKFTDEIKLPATSVKNQGKTGTCWSFATTSFLESELIRMGKGPMNLSEMYSVRMIYSDKARNYILRQGTANFSEGSLAHDVFRIIDLFGMLPQDAYPGLSESDTGFDHKELSYVLKGFLDGVLEAGNPGKHWEEAFNGILDCYIGKLPESFNPDGKNHDPRSFADDIGIVTDDYISITSFSHHPYNEFFILEIPDNYSNGSFLNLELDAMVEIIDHALENGYTVAWDGDVGEDGFSRKKGFALLPFNKETDSPSDHKTTEIRVTEKNRQENFESFLTTDDHLMHLTGRAVDQDGNKFYIIKNSWGEKGPYNGYLYMSEAYLKMKTIFITLNRESLPDKISRQL